MSIIDYLKEKKLQHDKQKQQNTLMMQKQEEYKNRYNGQIDLLLEEAESMKQSGYNTHSNFSYGPDGPSQKCWTTTIITDKGVLEHDKINDNGNQYQKYTYVFNNGEFALIRVADEKISNLLIKDSNGIFREINISELPLPNCQITAEDINNIINHFQKTNETEEKTSM